MHKWEEDIAPKMDRMEVPGGWLYALWHHGKPVMCFVPHVPQFNYAPLLWNSNSHDQTVAPR